MDSILAAESHIIDDETDCGRFDTVDDLWFADDAFVILQAGLKQFRVPRCLLIAQSTLLDQSISWHTDSSNVLYIQLGDPSDHLEYFLRAIYRSDYFEPPPARTVLHEVIALLSLSAKYKVAFLQKRALLHLASGYPWTLAAWRDRFQRSTFSPIKDYGLPYSTINVPKSLSVLQSVWQAGAVWLLPSAFYECCQYPIKDAMENLAWLDPELDAKVQRTIIMGQMRHMEASQRLVRSFLQRPSETDCRSSLECLNVRLHCADQVSSWSMLNPLGLWDEDDWHLLDEMCGCCVQAAKLHHSKACEELWNGLPELYDLPPWERLLNTMGEFGLSSH